MSEGRLRHSARALILDEDDAVLLCRFDFARHGGPVVWAAPGGGLEPGENEIDCLRRELAKEVGLRIDNVPPRVWRHEVVAPGSAAGYDGLVNHYFLVRTACFTPTGVLGPDRRAAENITGFAWWPVEKIASHEGPGLFSPRALALYLGDLVREGPPPAPLELPPLD